MCINNDGKDSKEIGSIEDVFAMDLPQIMRRELMVSRIERRIPSYQFPLLTQRFRDLCGRMRIYSVREILNKRHVSRTKLVHR